MSTAAPPPLIEREARGRSGRSKTQPSLCCTITPLLYYLYLFISLCITHSAPFYHPIDCPHSAWAWAGSAVLTPRPCRALFPSSLDLMVLPLRPPLTAECVLLLPCDE